MKFIFFIIIFLLTIKSLHSQPESKHTVRGVVIESSTGAEIPFANIFNESERTWVHAQNNGSFLIWADKNDTLVVSAIGYFSEVIFLSENLITDSLTIKLEARSYEIGEAVIKVPKKYSQFKQDVLNLELPKTELDKASEELSGTSKEVVQQAEYDRMVNEVFAREKGTLFVLGASIKTRKEKNKKKVKQIQSKEEEQNLIEIKFNHEIVKTLTKLPDNELTEFMVFCDFEHEFLLNSSEYEIIKMIYQKLEEYRNTNL